MTQLRDLMTHDNSRSLRQSEIDERLRYERDHADPGEVIDVLHLETDGPELAHCRAVLEDGRKPKAQTDAPPDDTDHVALLQGWGMTNRDCNMCERNCGTVGELRTAVANLEVLKWPHCGRDLLRHAVAALKRIDEAKR